METQIEIVAPTALAGGELQACLKVLKNCELPQLRAARTQLPRAYRIAVCRNAGKIIGLGVIKSGLASYAEGVSQESEYPIDPKTPELTYVAVEEEYRGKHISSNILGALLENFPQRPVFAVTSDEKMKASLQHQGFEPKGCQWENRAGHWESLWIKSC